MYVCERERERERERDFASSGPFGHVCLLQLGQGAGGGAEGRVPLASNR